MANRYPDEIRIAFDGDAMMFSDEAERVFQKDGLRAFVGHEIHNKDYRRRGPLKPLLEALPRLQRLADEAAPIRDSYGIGHGRLGPGA